MNFEASRAKALDKLNYFVENNLSDYSKLRNFDFGPENRSNISCLSPYITHGIINEIEVIKESLQKQSFSKCEKFINTVPSWTFSKGNLYFSTGTPVIIISHFFITSSNLYSIDI